MLVTTITVDADRPAADAVVRMVGVPDQAWVVVRRREGLEVRWYIYQASTLRYVADRDPSAVLEAALRLDSDGLPSKTYQLGTASREATGVLLDGDQVVGILAGAGGTRRFEGNHAARPHTSGADEETLQPVADDSAFAAHPELECPELVAVAQPFELAVRLTGHESPGTFGGPLEVPTDLQEFDLVVAVVVPGFAVERVREVLHVVRDDLAANEVRFALTPEPITGALSLATLQVDFTFGGGLVGRAWRPVIVTATPQTPAPAVADPALLHQPSPTPLLLTSSENRPDLTITITENDDGTQLEWQFETPHAGVELPTGPVRRRFKESNAKSFAMEQIRVIDESRGTGVAATRMTGAAGTIADEVPPPAWRVLSDVWRRVKAQGRLPSVLLVSTDAFVPWELASTDPAYVDADLVDSHVPPILGAQVCISRWTAPQPRGAHGVLNPPLPPPEVVNVTGMALVVGDYLAENGIRPLPMATQEGTELVARYGALRLTATTEDLSRLLRVEIVRDGQPFDPEVVHFACHGQIDPNPGFNGIVLNSVSERLDTLFVRGSRMQRPFVFLNACQVGQNTQLLDDAGGLGASFLKTGASGFVAPLWSVDDQLALDTALAFYQAAFDDRVPVAEALRRRRCLFDPNAARAELTHLAYTYYGHPNLVLART